jgi:hypothetical protein
MLFIINPTRNPSPPAVVQVRTASIEGLYSFEIGKHIKPKKYNNISVLI